MEEGVRLGTTEVLTLRAGGVGCCLRIPAPGRAEMARLGVGVGGGRVLATAAKETLRWGVMGGESRFGGDGGGVGGEEERRTAGEEETSLD